jgi:hypothetical protein
MEHHPGHGQDRRHGGDDQLPHGNGHPTRGGRLYSFKWAGPHPAGLLGADYILTGKHKRKKV